MGATIKMLKGIDTRVLDVLSDHIIIVDSETYKIVFANKAFIKNFSSKKNIIGFKCKDYFCSNTHSPCKVEKLLLEEGKREVIIETDSKENKEYFSVSVSIIEDDDGNKYFIHSSRNITNEKENENELKKSESKYREMFNNLYNVFFEVSLSGTIYNISPSVERISGYKREDLIGKNVMDLYEDFNKRNEYVELLTKNGAVDDYEVVFKNKDGKKLICSITSKIVVGFDNENKIIGVLRDVTNEHKAKENLNKINGILLTLFDTSTSLQNTNDINVISEIAIDTFSKIGYDRVRIYIEKNDVFHGIRSNHMMPDEFTKLNFIPEDKESKAYKAINTKRPIIIKDKLTKLGKILDKVGLEESATLPLLSINKVIGLISIDNKFSKKKILETDLDLLMTFANQIAIAIDNSILYHKNQNRLNIWSALYDISSATSATLDLNKILNLMVIKIIKLLKADVCRLLLLDETGNNLIPYAVCDIYNEKPKLLGGINIDESISGITIKRNKPLYIADMENNNIGRKARKDLLKSKLKTMLSVPLQVENIPIGVINLYTKNERTYMEEELELIISIANQAAVVIENSRLYERVRSDKDKLSTLLEISKIINSTLDIDTLFDKILNMAMRFTDSDFGYITVLEDKKSITKYCKGYIKSRIGSKALENNVCNMVFNNAEIFIVHNNKEKKYSGINKQTSSFVAIPLMKQNVVFAVLVLESKKIYNYKWYDKSIRILMNHISVAIENSFLYNRISSFNEELKEEVEKATEELRVKNEELKKIDRMKDDFVSNVSHELRTPLTSIVGYSKLLRVKKLGDLNDQQVQSLKIIEEESVRLTRLINNVLDLSKLESGKLEARMEKIDIKNVVKSAIDTIKSYAEENKITIKSNINSSKSITASSDMLKQVLLNLLNNAIKFTKENGKITVNLKDKGKDKIKIEVIDSGVGISQDDIKKLFSKFFQVDSSLTRFHGGSGLGLVIVKHIVDLHNGKVEVKSKEGVGSNFSIILPVEQEVKKD